MAGTDRSTSSGYSSSVGTDQPSGPLEQASRPDCAGEFGVTGSCPQLSSIFNYREVSASLGTAGQPSVDQFAMIRAAGYEVVINLALTTSDNAIANEGSLVAGLGMAYVHIPVDFARPTAADFEAFAGVLDAFRNRRVFVHCADEHAGLGLCVHLPCPAWRGHAG